MLRELHHLTPCGYDQTHHPGTLRRRNQPRKLRRTDARRGDTQQRQRDKRHAPLLRIGTRVLPKKRPRPRRESPGERLQPRSAATTNKHPPRVERGYAQGGQGVQHRQRDGGALILLRDAGAARAYGYAPIGFQSGGGAEIGERELRARRHPRHPHST